MQELVLNPAERVMDADAVNQGERTGVHEEFELRLHECGPLAFRVAQGVLRNAADAEDIAQETLLRAFGKFRDLRDPGRFKSWIVRIAFRLALDRWRSRKRREVRETEWSQPWSDAFAPSAQQVAEANAFQERLGRALDELPEKLRLVVILSAIQGYTLEEVSKLLEIPTGTVKSRLFFARKQLAEKLR
jgi:RNA polymerase sigma-70 factor (ECF subfamily)